MDGTDLHVLRNAAAWQAAGRRTALVTVLRTRGSAPRPAGALLALSADGRLAGSVSGGCVEEDLLDRHGQGEFHGRPTLLAYGVSREQGRRLGLPCGGTLELLVEPDPDPALLERLVAALARRELLARREDVRSGRCALQPARRSQDFAYDGAVLTCVHGPAWRLLLIGAGQLSRSVAQMAPLLDYEVIVRDPRKHYVATWDVAGAPLDTGMPDDVVRARASDARSAVLALTHDPKLDDLALLEALVSDAFCVGVLGSRANNAKRRARLAALGVPAAALARLHGPVGLAIGSRTPPEIAVATLAELTAVRRGVRLAPAAAVPASPQRVSA
ncbi:MAG: XdhC family protein [Pseudomonadota bacterium]